MPDSIPCQHRGARSSRRQLPFAAACRRLIVELSVAASVLVPTASLIGKPQATGAQVAKSAGDKSAKDDLYGDQGGAKVAKADASAANTVMRARRDDTFIKLSNPRVDKVKGPDAKGKGNGVIRNALLIDFEVIRLGTHNGAVLVIHTPDGKRAEADLGVFTGPGYGTLSIESGSRVLGQFQVDQNAAFPKNAELYLVRGDRAYQPPRFMVSNSVVLGAMKTTTLPRNWTPAEIKLHGKPPDKAKNPPPVPPGVGLLAVGTDVPIVPARNHRFVEPEGRLLGLEYRMGEWDGEKRVGDVIPVFKAEQPKKLTRVMARDGYAVAGAELNAGRSIYGIRLLFRRVNPDGTLDKADAYASEWLGIAPEAPPRVLVNDGRRVIGISVIKYATVDRFALVVDK